MRLLGMGTEAVLAGTLRLPLVLWASSDLGYYATIGGRATLICVALGLDWAAARRLRRRLCRPGPGGRDVGYDRGGPSAYAAGLRMLLCRWAGGRAGTRWAAGGVQRVWVCRE